MNFPYMYTIQSYDSIDIEDLGNVCLNALSDQGREYYLGIDCNLGWTTIVEFGPLAVDMNTIPSSFNFHYSHVEYDERKLKTLIDGFINNPKRMVTQVLQIEKDTLYDRLHNLKMEET